MKSLKKYLIIGVSTIGFCLYLVINLAGGLSSSGIVIDFDIKLSGDIKNFWSPALIKFFTAITYLGDFRLIIVFLVIASVVLAIKKKWFYLAVLMGANAGGEAASFLIKNIFQRSRPEFNGVIFYGNGFSFPSGHALISFIFYGLCAYLIIKNIKNNIVKFFLCLFTFILVILIGFSRIYLGVHWFSDVLAGYALGFIWLVLAFLFLKYFENKK